MEPCGVGARLARAVRVRIVRRCGLRPPRETMETLDKMLGRMDGFAVGAGTRSCTLGAWLWSAPVPLSASWRGGAVDMSLLVMDVEGLQGNGGVGRHGGVRSAYREELTHRGDRRRARCTQFGAETSATTAMSVSVLLLCGPLCRDVLQGTEGSLPLSVVNWPRHTIMLVQGGGGGVSGFTCGVDRNE